MIIDKPFLDRYRGCFELKDRGASIRMFFLFSGLLSTEKGRWITLALDEDMSRKVILEAEMCYEAKTKHTHFEMYGDRRTRRGRHRGEYSLVKFSLLEETIFLLLYDLIRSCLLHEILPKIGPNFEESYGALSFNRNNKRDLEKLFGMPLYDAIGYISNVIPTI